MGQVQQSRAQIQHREQFKKWMGQDNRHVMDKKRVEYAKEHSEYLRRLIRDMAEPGFRFGL